MYSRLPSLFLCSLGLSLLSVGEPVALAQPAPADKPADAPTDNPTARPPTPPTDPPPAEPAESPPAPTVEPGTISGTIRSPDLGAPLAGATVTIEGTSISAISDDTGRFTLSAPPGNVTLRAESTGFQTVEKQLTVTAGQAADVDLPLSFKQQDEVVVVVGSRTPRTNLETTAPVDIVTAEDIAHVGKTETGRILSTLAPSFISTPQTIADGTDHVDPAALRGLGPDQVLVLINGRRRHKSALLNVNGTYGRGTVGTDLNAIPAGSIKRIEVLRDGAASQYGSDAIAGVINIVTKGDTDLADISTLTGVTGSGDGGQIKTSANYGFKIGSKGFLNFTGEFLKKNATNRAGRYTGNVFTSPTGPNIYSPTADPIPMGGTPPIDDQIIRDRGLTRDSFGMRIGEAASEGAMGSYNMEVPIDSVSTFYSSGDLAHRNGDAAAFYRYPNQTTQNVAAFYPNGFLPEIHSNINDLGITVGVRRKGDWNVDASLTHGQNSFQFNVENSVNASLGTNSPTSFNSGTLSAQETLADLDLLHKIKTGVVKSLAFVIGAEVRTENYKITAGDVASYTFGGAMTSDNPPAVTAPGAQVFPGFQPSNEVDRTRNNVGIYAGLESEIIRGLNVDVGGRYENYSDFGNSFTGKIAARVPVNKVVAVRGAASTGFRAPSLQQLWFSNVSSLFLADSAGNLTPNQVLTSNNASPITGKEGFGIPKLKQETSINLSGGVTVRPLENLSLTADSYFIRLKNRITLTNQFTNTLNRMRYAPVADILDQFRGVTAAQFFANAVDTDTLGLDVVADYAVYTKTGTVTLSAVANFTRTEVKDVNIPRSLQAAFPTADAAQLNTFFFDRLAKNRLEDAVPHQKGNLSARYNYKQLSALLRANYYGRVRFKPAIPANDETFGAKVLFDADVGYQFTKVLQFTIGADNLFNTFPDQNTKAANISLGRFIYNRNVSQFGLNGGFYYAKLELTFF